MFAGTNSGLNNQRWELITQLAMAKQLSWTFVAGQVNMELFKECGGATGFAPFSAVYSLDALVEWATMHNVTIASDLTPELQVRAMLSTLCMLNPLCRLIAVSIRTRASDIEKRIASG